MDSKEEFIDKLPTILHKCGIEVAAEDQESFNLEV